MISFFVRPKDCNVRQPRVDLGAEKSKLQPNLRAVHYSGQSNSVPSPRRLEARKIVGVIQYSTSFSPFSEISFWNCATILSRRAISALVL